MQTSANRFFCRGDREHRGELVSMRVRAPPGAFGIRGEQGANSPKTRRSAAKGPCFSYRGRVSASPTPSVHATKTLRSASVYVTKLRLVCLRPCSGSRKQPLQLLFGAITWAYRPFVAREYFTHTAPQRGPAINLKHFTMSRHFNDEAGLHQTPPLELVQLKRHRIRAWPPDRDAGGHGHQTAPPELASLKPTRIRPRSPDRGA